VFATFLLVSLFVSRFFWPEIDQLWTTVASSSAISIWCILFVKKKKKPTVFIPTKKEMWDNHY